MQNYIAAAIAIEGIISWIKTITTEKKVQWPVIISLVISFLLVFDLKLNVFTLLEFQETYPIIGMSVTAIAISRGTNYFYEFYDRLVNWKKTEEKEGV